MPNALFSVYDKTGIVEFAWSLIGLGYKIFASGGTAKKLAGAGVPATDIAKLVGGGPILGHRVVTLSREIHAGLLARYCDADIQELERLGIPRIDLLCGNLYPLQEEIDRPGSTQESVMEMTDIGGPTLLSSAAKGGRIVICDSMDRYRVLDWLRKGKPNEKDSLRVLAAKAEAVVANYRLISARYHGQGRYDGIIGERQVQCHYGENAWQQDAGFYSSGTKDPLALDQFKLEQGAPLSYNGFCDLDRALQTITHIAAAFIAAYGADRLFLAVGCKHGNPCGAAVGSDSEEVIKKMIAGDPLAIFGGLIITNSGIDTDLARIMLDYQAPSKRVLGGVVASSFTPMAKEILRRKDNNCRLLSNPTLAILCFRILRHTDLDTHPRFRYVRGGFLLQPNYTYVLDFRDSELEKVGDASPLQEKDLLLAWAIGSTSNSNTITLVRDGQLIGNGVGQQSRVAAAKLAVSRAQDAGHDTEGAVAYSDSFFPFTDGPKYLAEHGIKAILASSGSIRDSEVKECCAAKGVALYLIPDKKGRGFFGH